MKGAAAVSSIGLLFGALTIPFAWWPTPPSVAGSAAFALYVLLAAGLAVDSIEVFCALVWKPAPPRLALKPIGSANVAVLLTVCDDAQAHAFRALAPLAKSGFDVFVLDDSQRRVVLPPSLLPLVRHVVRAGRRGAKAGNLNHWIRWYGDQYEFAFILDADSVMPLRTARKLLRAAAHADHRDVAIFQAKIASRTVCATPFSRAAGGIAPARWTILERVHAPLGLLLSSGHNQLLRLEAVKSVGGFREEYTAEDTALSLELARKNWRTVLVDAWTLDGSPATVATYNRRTIRWARATVELFRGDWRGTPTRLKLLLCCHLLTFVSAPAGFVLLAMSVWLGPRDLRQAIDFMRASIALAPGYAFYGFVLWFVCCLYLGNGVLHAVVARREGIGWKRIAAASAATCAAYASLITPLTTAMLTTALGRRTQFVPTNSHEAVARDTSVAAGVGSSLGVACLLAALLIGAWRHPASALVSLSFVWLLMLAASPFAALGFAWSARRQLKGDRSGTVRP